MPVSAVHASSCKGSSELLSGSLSRDFGSWGPEGLLGLPIKSYPFSPGPASGSAWGRIKAPVASRGAAGRDMPVHFVSNTHFYPHGWLRRGSPKRPQAVPAAQLWLWVSPSPRTDSQQPYVTAAGPKSQLGSCIFGVLVAQDQGVPSPAPLFPIPIRAPQRRSAGELGDPRGHLLGDMPVPTPAKAATCNPPGCLKAQPRGP